MPALNTLTALDFSVAALVAYFLLRGLWTGCMRQFASLLALGGSYLIAAQYAQRLLPWTERFIESQKVTFIVSFAILFLVALVVFHLTGKVLRRCVQVILLGWFDRLAGMALGGAKAVLMASLGYLLLASSLSATSPLLRTSYCGPWLSKGAEILRSAMVDPRLRDSFAIKEPAILDQAVPEKNSGIQNAGKPSPPTFQPDQHP